MYQEQATLRRSLTLRDGLALVVGTVIGSGIFLVPAAIGQQVPFLAPVILLWIAGGILSICGSLALAEIGSRLPGSGGLYVYLREIYGRPVGALYGWCLLTTIQSGTIASLAAAFAIYFSRLWGPTYGIRFVPAVLILSLSGLNILGIRHGKLFQNVSTVAKLAGIMLLLAALTWRGHKPHFSPVPGAPSHVGIAALGVALISVMWAYEGWHTVSFTSGEFKNVQRDLPRSLYGGAAICMVLYTAVTVVYYAVLSPSKVAVSTDVAAAAVRAVYPEPAAAFISLLILCSIVGATNGMILTGPRVYQAMSADRLFFEPMGKIDPRFRTPALAIAIQGIWSALLTFVASFQQLYSDVVFSAWIFYALAVFGLVLMRRRYRTRPAFRVPFYPAVVFAFVAAAFFIVVSQIRSDPKHAFAGLGIDLLGLPVFWFFEYRSQKQMGLAG